MPATTKTDQKSGAVSCAVRPPSLNNQPPQSWQQHAQIAYLFARHARHDLANIHCALGLFDLVESMQESGIGAAPLPPELEPDRIKEKCKQDVKQLISVSNDLILISQAASTVPYQMVHTVTVAELVNSAIVDRLGEEHPAPPSGVCGEFGDAKLVAYGDQLSAALAVFYFQWTPWASPHKGASRVSIRGGERRVVFEIPADDTESVAGFARRLHSGEASPIASIADRVLSITTAELAFWMARFVVMIHGGVVEVDPNDPLLTLRVALPVIA